MGVTCPDKRLSSWKNLVKIQGENISYFLWNEYSGNVPEKYYNSAYNKEIQYQKQTNSDEGIIAAEKTIRDLAARMADRIGMKVKFESDRSKDYKGKIENNTSVINLAYATLDTPIHEILGHPIIRAIKTGVALKQFPVSSSKLQELYPSIYKFEGKTQEEFNKHFEQDELLAKEQYLKDNPKVAEEYNKKDNNTSQLYKNLLKELGYGRGKEVLDRIKRDYQYKEDKKLYTIHYDDYYNGIYKFEGKEFNTREELYDFIIKNDPSEQYNVSNIEKIIKGDKYTLEEQQEEAIVELLGLMTAEKLDAVKDGKLISLLKRLLKEIKAFVKDLLRQREVDIDKLPDNMTLGDLADLLAYSNSKLILPGNEVIYTAPDNMKFKTYGEASKHISDLAKSVRDIDVQSLIAKTIPDNIELDEFTSIIYDAKSNTYTQYSYDEEYNKNIDRIKISIKEAAELYKNSLTYQKKVLQQEAFDEEKGKGWDLFNTGYAGSDIEKFIEKNKEYEQSKEIIEEWKRVNNIRYNPEEVYSRGQGFYSIAGAFADFDVKLMFQNLLAHIEDNKKAGGQFTISATTDIPDHSKSNNSIITKNYGKNIYYKIYPKSEDILWATPEDCSSGSVLDASEKVGSKLGKEITGVSYTKYPSKDAIDRVQASLAETLDKTVTNRNFYNYNELGINLTETNFRLEYDEDVPYATKKIINSINSILDQKYGKLVAPEISKKPYQVEAHSKEESDKYKKEGYKSIKFDHEYDVEILVRTGKQPTQTNETLKESINSVKIHYGGNKNNAKLLTDELNKEIKTLENLKEILIRKPNDWTINNGIKKKELRIKELNEVIEKLGGKKEYTSQALINTIIAKLKEVAKKYPRILIRSEVKPIDNNTGGYVMAEEGELPFQKLPSKKKVESFFYSSRLKDRIAIPLKDRPDLYKAFNLLNTDGSIISYPKITKEALDRLNGLNKSAELYDFDLRKTTDGKYRIFPLKPIEAKPEAIQGELFRLSTADYQEPLMELENKLIDIIQRKYGIPVNVYDSLKDRLGVDALGFTKLMTGTAEIGIRKYRDRMTLPEEAAHIFIAMLDGTPLYNRLINWLGKEDYYKKVLDNEYEQYNELYKGNIEKLKVEAAGKLLGQTLIAKNVIPPTEVKSLLQRIWDAIKRLVGKFPINEIERELNILTNEISDAALNEKMDSIQGSTENIKPFVEEDLSILYQVGNKIKTEQQLKDQTLTSIAKRIQYFKRTGQDKKVDKYQELEEKYNKFLDDGNYLKGIGLYLETLSEEKKGFNKGLRQIKQSFNNPEREDLRSVAKNLRQMHTVINNNSSTLEHLIDLFGDFLYDSDYEFKAEAKELKKSAEKMLSYFNRLEQDYIRIGLQVTAEMMAPLLGKRNDTDVLADLNRNRPANKQLSILNLEEALLKGDADINFINRWLDAVAEVPDDLLKILDIAVKNQKIEAQQETLEDKKILLDAQDKLKESTEFVVEKVDGKLTGNVVTEYDWGLMKKKEDDFFKKLNIEIKSKYGYEYKDFMSKSEELMKKFGQAEYISDRQNYKKQIAKLFSTTRLSDEEIAKELEGKSDIWKHFNTETNQEGRLIIPRVKSKTFESIKSNPNQLEYYNAVTNLMYELDSLLPEQKRLGRKLPQIRKDFVERLKMAIKDKSTEAYASIFTELKENFQVLEDEDRRGMKFELSDDGITPIKFLPIYYVNKLKNPNEISTDITSSLTIFSSMARDYAKMNEIIDLMEIARDVINVRDIVRTDSKGNPEVESVKTAKSKLLRTLFIPQGTSRMADLLHDFYNMQIYGELEKEEKIAGTNLDRAKIIDALTRYAALNMLSLNVFSGFQNVVTGVAQEKIDSIAKEFISFDALKFADGKYYGLKNFSNLLGSVGSIDGKNPATGEHSELILWGEKFDVMQDFKSENKELDSSRKTIFGRLFKTSTLMFIQKSGENWLNMRTSLALAHEYRYSKDLEKFVWKEDFYMPLRKLEYKRKDEIKQLSGDDIKGKIESINSKYKQEETTLKEKLDKSWKEMTNYYDAHEKIGRRLKLKSEFKENKEDVQAFMKKTNFLNKRFHGIYNDADKSAAQQFALFRVVNLFRKFMVPFWNRRYGKTQFSYEGQAWTEGYYITVFNFIRNIIMESRAGEYSLRKNWATLSELEKANFKRAMMDAGQVLGMMVIAMVLGAVADGGDDDDWTLQMALYIANRSITELGAFTPSPLMLSEGLRTIQSPTAAITPLKRVADLMQPWEWNNEIERGRYKGWTKGEKLLYQSVPALNKLKDVSSPAEMMVFYN